MMSQPEKVCVICGESCAGQARIKDAKGNYAHRACAEAKKTSRPAPEPAPAGDVGMDALWDDLPEVEEPVAMGAPSMCPVKTVNYSCDNIFIIKDIESIT